MSSTVEPSYPGMMPPPAGVTPNLVNPESVGWKLVLASVLCPVFAILFWLLRLYTSRFIVRKFWVDDSQYPFQRQREDDRTNTITSFDCSRRCTSTQLDRGRRPVPLG